MWQYSQSTGKLWNGLNKCVAIGYSGFGDCKNSPPCETIVDRGPIPRGLWVIGEPYNSKNTGPFCLPLVPSGHNAHTRTSFLIHGDSIAHPGQASHGCIILQRHIRQLIHASTDKILQVIE